MQETLREVPAALGPDCLGLSIIQNSVSYLSSLRGGGRDTALLRPHPLKCACHSCIHPFHKHLFNAYCMPSTLLTCELITDEMKWSELRAKAHQAERQVVKSNISYYCILVIISDMYPYGNYGMIYLYKLLTLFLSNEWHSGFLCFFIIGLFLTEQAKDPFVVNWWWQRAGEHKGREPGKRAAQRVREQDSGKNAGSWGRPSRSITSSSNFLLRQKAWEVPKIVHAALTCPICYKDKLLLRFWIHLCVSDSDGSSLTRLSDCS